MSSKNWVKTEVKRSIYTDENTSLLHMYIMFGMSGCYSCNLTTGNSGGSMLYLNK